MIEIVEGDLGRGQDLIIILFHNHTYKVQIASSLNWYLHHVIQFLRTINGAGPCIASGYS
jgi:hypothetical protein